MKFRRSFSLSCLRSGIAALLLATTIPIVNAQYSLNNLWTISTADGRPYITSGATERGIAYNPATNHVYLTSRAGVPARVAILNGDNGGEVGFLNVTAVSGGTFALSMIGVADDGAIYGANLSGSSTGIPTFRLYRWADESAAPVLVFTGNPAGAGSTAFGRWGDNMDVRGSGTNTEVLVASDGLLAAILRPTDETMSSFATTGLTVSGLAATDMQKGVAFGTNNTFYAKRTGLGTLRHIRYNLAAGTASVIADYTINAGVAGVSFDTNTFLVAGVQTANATTGHQLNVYDASINGSLPLVGTIAFPAPGTANPNLVGAVHIAGGRIYAVDTQNGVIAAQIVESPTPVPPNVVNQPASQTVVQGGYTSFNGAATGSRPISYQWELNGIPIPGETGTTLLLTNVTPSQAGDYRLTANNVAGSGSSTNAALTVTPAVLTSGLTPLWKRSPGQLPFLSATDGNHRGMAYNPQSGHLLVVSRTGSNAVHIIDADTGNHLGALNPGAGVITGGTLPLNMIAVAPDGFIYAGNLTTNGITQEFKLYLWTDEDPNTTPIVIWHGDPGTNVISGTSTANRWGDTMAARLGPNGHEILLSSRSGTAVSILSPDGGDTWPPFVFDVSGATAGNFGLGIAWGEGDTFWGKSSGHSLRHVQLDFANFGASILSTFNNFPQMSAIGVDPAQNLLAGISVETPDNLRLFDISNEGLAYLDTEFWPTDNANPNATGAIAFAPERLYALDSNNGIMAFRISPRLRYQVTGSTITFTWSGAYTLQSRNNLTSGTWNDVSSTSGHQVTMSTAPGTQTYYRLRQ